MIKMHHLDAVDHVQSSRDIVTLGTQVWKADVDGVCSDFAGLTSQCRGIRHLTVICRFGGQSRKVPQIVFRGY